MLPSPRFRPVKIDPEVIARLPADAPLQITIRAGDLARALREAHGGPEWLSTVEASRLLGYSARRWRDWAQAGEIPGAHQDDGRWRLPNAACREHLGIVTGRSPRRLHPPDLPRPHGPRKVRS